MISRFFIDRPIFAGVVAIVMVLAGALSTTQLAVEQFPEVTPPTVQVRANYPGADARTVADTIAAPIEQEVNGVEGMLYMSSVSADDGSYSLTITFELGSDVDLAAVREIDVYRVWREQEPRSLTGAVRRFLGRELVGAHDALQDARATAEVSRALAELFGLTPEDLLRLSKPPWEVDRAGKFRRDAETGAVCFGFGRLRG